MKNLTISLIISCLLFASCKKQSTQKSPVYLLSKMTLNGGGYTHVYTYAYDDKNRLTEVNSDYLSDIYKFTYDNNNNLLTAGTYDYSNQLSSVFKFSYSGNTVTASFYTDYGNTLYTTYVLKLNAMHLVDTILNEGQTQTYTYDFAGNITRFTSFGGGTLNYTYDNEKHPLSMIGAKNYFVMYFFIEDSDPTAFVNNMISDVGDQSYSYTYNAAGFPTVKMYTGSTITEDFEYIVK